MPVKFQALTERTHSITVNHLGDDVSITYRPGQMTAGLVADMAKVAENVNAESIETLVQAMVKLVADWDVLQEDDTHLPVTAENVRMLPLDFLTTVLVSMRQAVGPEAEGKA
jgi:hypothetical protein